MTLITDRLAIKKSILDANNSPWRPLHRIENTGGAVNDVMDGSELRLF